MSTQTADYFTVRGLHNTTPEALDKALQVVLDNMPTSYFGDTATELTMEEQAVLREGGVSLEPISGPDAMAQTMVQYAAIVKRSVSSKQASQLLGLAPSRIRQMIADRSLYSFLIDGNRYIPDFQFTAGSRLIPNIIRINKVLNPKIHPVEVYDWYHHPNVDLFLNDDIDITSSPLDWLRSGQNLELLLLLASRL